jgi:putative PIN family toxin of toxin-antitoxin system
LKVFLDTNVIVSALATRGLCADVLRLVISRHELILGEVVLEELETVLRGKLGLPEPLIEEVLVSFREHSVEPRPEEAPVDLGADPADAWVLASALASGAEFLITGDRHLLGLSLEGKLQIVTPRVFWDRTRG